MGCMKKRKRTQRSQTTRRIRRRTGNVATTLTTLATPRFPSDLFKILFKIASGHRVIARESGVDDTWTLASALSARSLRTLRSKIKTIYFRN